MGIEMVSTLNCNQLVTQADSEVNLTNVIVDVRTP